MGRILLRRCFLLGILWVCLVAGWGRTISPALAQEGGRLDRPLQPHLETEDPVAYTLRPGETFACLAQRAGAGPAELARDNRLLLTTALAPGTSLHLSPHGSSPFLTTLQAHRDDTPLRIIE